MATTKLFSGVNPLTSLATVATLEQIECNFARAVDSVVQFGIAEEDARRLDLAASLLYLHATRLVQLSSNRETAERVRKGLGLTD